MELTGPLWGQERGLWDHLTLCPTLGVSHLLWTNFLPAHPPSQTLLYANHPHKALPSPVPWLACR